MKVLIFSLLALCFFCHKDRIEVIDAYSQEWIAGQQDGNNGTNYFFAIKVSKSSENLAFKELWIGNERIPFRLFTDIHTTGDTTFAKNDTVYIRGQIIEDNYLDVKDTSEISVEEPPIDYTGEALIVYTYRQKLKYYVVKEVEKKSTLRRP